ncbi:hypothetical protein AAG906_007867 [Vitis piasezkii]
MASNSNSNLDELKWATQTRRILDEEVGYEGEVPVSIFNVPKTLLATKPDCHIPQKVEYIYPSFFFIVFYYL